MRHYMGIDVGKEGAIVLLDNDAKIVEMAHMPIFAERVDPRGLFQLLKKMTDGKEVLVYLEKAFCMPAQGRVSIMNYGMYAGFCEMALAALGLSYELVMPQKWQKDLHAGIDTKINPKIRSALKVQRLLGLDQFMVGKQTKPHTGLVDAYLIAMHAHRETCRAEGKKLPSGLEQHKKKKASAAS